MLLRSLVKLAVGDTNPRVIDVKAQQEAEAEEEMRRVCALAYLDLNSVGIPTQTQQGDINARNSPMGHSVALKLKGNAQVCHP